MSATKTRAGAAESEQHVVPNALTVQANSMASVSDETEIDLMELIYALMDKIWYIIFFTLLGAVMVNALFYYASPAYYTSTAKMYMLTSSDDSIINLSDFNIGSFMTLDYTELMMSYPVLDRVVERLGGDLTEQDIFRSIKINNPQNTRILEVTATTNDRQLSCDLANTMVEIAIEYLPKTMGVEEPNVAQEARISEVKAGPNYNRYTFLGAALGFIICSGIFIMKYLLDDTIHNTEDMERYFGITTLAVIPDIDSANMMMDRRKQSRKRREKKHGND